MQILLTNDDGIYAPGLEALEAELSRIGQVQVVAPAVEQSGVGHSITYLEPLIVQDVHRRGRLFGRAVAGSPADCVKMAMLELCKPAPELVVSGINSGANVGINVLYSGTVAAAIEGAFFGVTSIAVSLSMDRPPDFARAARLAVDLISELIGAGIEPGSLWNLNLPDTRPGWPKGIKTLPMGVDRYQELVERRTDPRGRNYYWCATDPNAAHKRQPDTDVEGIAEGFMTLTPLHFNLTDVRRLALWQGRTWRAPESS